MAFQSNFPDSIPGDNGSLWIYDDKLGGYRPKTMAEMSSMDVGSSDESIMDLINRMAFPVGTTIPFAGNGDLPAGFLLCNGASVLRTAYPDLFAVIGTLYGAVDDEHFNLPNMNGRFIEGSDTAGTVKEAGLPNIEGSFYSITTGPQDTTGAFTSSSNYTANCGNASRTWPLQNITIDASKSNSIYGNSDTVQPPSLTMRWIIKAFKGASSSSTDLEITQVANDLNAKLDKKAIASYVVESVVNDDGSWYRRYSDGWLEQGGIHTISNDTNETINYLKPLSKAIYANIIEFTSSAGSTNNSVIKSINTTYMNAYINLANNLKALWVVCGMGAE